MSQLESLMASAQAEESEAPTSEAAPEPTEAATPPVAAAESEAASDAEKKPLDPKAAQASEAASDAEKKPLDPKAAQATDKVAARFAALAREKKQTLDLKEQVTSTARQLQQREQEIGHREQAIAAKLADAEKVLLDPARLFDHLEKLGIRSVEDLAKHARGQWERPKPKEEEDPSKRPLTRAEFEHLQKQREDQSRQAQAAEAFTRMIEAEENGESKYEAAALLYSPEERVRHGDRIAAGLAAQGITFSLEDIADAVDELARQDKRYAKLQKRARVESAPAQSKSAPAGAAKAPDTSGRQSSQARTPTNDVATERANGAAPRLSHRERMQRLMGG